LIESKGLTRELRALVRRLEADIRSHAENTEELGNWLHGEFRRAKEGGRTGQAFESWRDEQVTLSAVGWALTCVFVRFCEDNGLVAEPRLAGPEERLEAAADTTRHFFQQHPGKSDREYLLWVFDQIAVLPGMSGLMQARESRMHELPLSVDGATELLEFWRERDPESGELAFDFTDPDRNTRFLGDLYQDLSEAAKKRYALLQTPIFIEEFILDRTLDPAIEDFGLRDASVIDPACGSGHFLLGAFDRLLARWREREPETNVRVLCQQAFNRIAGVDINPFAVAIAHFRLLVAALNACEIHELRGAPDFTIEVASGDSLLHGHPPGQLPNATGAWARPEHQHFYEAENREHVTRILDRRYAAVVANPPYITPKDPALRDAYRDRYDTCHGKYALSVPFMERLFDLAARAEKGHPDGYVGQITSNSFMKREFGKKLIEEYLASEVDLEAIIDTSGAYIPGHGTPTVILIGRPHSPVGDTVRGVLGIRGEPSTPPTPATGKVWSEIVSLVDQPGEEGIYVSAEDIDRQRLVTHPWSLRGGGAAEVKAAVEQAGDFVLADASSSVGITAVTGEDDLYKIGDRQTAARLRVDPSRPLVEGDEIRDWSTPESSVALWTYDGNFVAAEPPPQSGSRRLLWQAKAVISHRRRFGTPMLERGLNWWEWQELYSDKLQAQHLITFAQIATHNHFVLDHVGNVYKQSAPVIKLPEGASETAHLELIGPLNSSTGCFWMKQVCHCKGSTVDQAGARQTTVPFEDFYDHDSTKLARFPLPPHSPLAIAEALDESAAELARYIPTQALSEQVPSGDLLAASHDTWLRIRQSMIALQEELDWECYRLYGLLDEDLNAPLDELPDVELGERAFEIVLARKLAAGEVETTWFERHGSTPVTETPARWPQPYRLLVERRVEAIEETKAIKLIEQPEYKRRWTTLMLSKWESIETEALRGWLLDRIESASVWPDTQLASAGQVADWMLGDEDFQAALVLFASEDVRPAEVVAKLLAEESVPFLAAHRYTASGMEKRAVWERTWDLQRAEDRGEFTGLIDVPPKYKQADFRSPVSWKRRGKLDVPKERFTSYPDAAADGATLYGWAGWNDAQRAQGLSRRIVEAQEGEGVEPQRLMPLLAGLLELLPWLHQWHAEPDPDYEMPLSDFYDTFLDERVRAIDATREDLSAWRPAEVQRKRRPKKAAA
jgi:hypothetical protein